MAVSWKRVGMGVAAASIGAAAFGAVHFMFLAPQFGVGDFMGIPLNVVLPILFGALGFTLPYLFKMKPGTAKEVVQYGSAAVIGFGIAQYAGWIQPLPAARARASAMRFTPQRRVAPRTIAPTGAHLI